MPKYRKKPVIVEAEQWFCNKDEVKGVQRYCGDNPDKLCDHCGGILSEHGHIETLEGLHIVCPGDFIITGVKGERYPCKPDVFSATYEPVPEQNEPTMGKCKTVYMLMFVQRFNFKPAPGTELSTPIDVSVKTPPGVLGFQYIFDSLESLHKYAPDGSYMELEMLENGND